MLQTLKVIYVRSYIAIMVEVESLSSATSSMTWGKFITWRVGRFTLTPNLCSKLCVLMNAISRFQIVNFDFGWFWWGVDHYWSIWWCIWGRWITWIECSWKWHWGTCWELFGYWICGNWFRLWNEFRFEIFKCHNEEGQRSTDM